MLDGWTSTRVADLSSERTATASGPFGSNLVSADYRDTGVPVIRGENLGRGRWIQGPFAYVTEAKAASLSGNLAIPGDVVFTQRGTLGQVALVPPEPYPGYVLSQSQMRLRADPRRADSEFLYYLFSSPEQQGYIQARAIQTGVPHTNLTILRETPLNLPPIDEQRAIASVLGALDDKIELNRRTNETLEALARAIFTSWFVDFDPVRARAEGRQPVGMDAETAALFPDSFADSPLGPVPSGWYAGALGDVVAMNRRSRLPGYPHDEIDYVDIASVKEGRLESSTPMRLADAPSRARRLVEDGDVIWSCVRPNRRSYLRIDNPPDNRVVSTGFVVLTPTIVPSSYLYLSVATDDFVDYLTANADGSAYPAVRPEHFDRAPLLIPDEGALRAFDVAAEPLLRRLAANERESRTLAETRDALLPKLVSGEIRVAPTAAD